MMKQKSFVLTSRRIFCKARHGRNVFVCLFCGKSAFFVKEQLVLVYKCGQEKSNNLYY